MSLSSFSLLSFFTSAMTYFARAAGSASHMCSRQPVSQLFNASAFSIIIVVDDLRTPPFNVGYKRNTKHLSLIYKSCLRFFLKGSIVTTAFRVTGHVATVPQLFHIFSVPSIIHIFNPRA